MKLSDLEPCLTLRAKTFSAIKALRTEVSTLVVEATEKLLGRNLQGDDHKRIVEDYVNELSKN